MTLFQTRPWQPVRFILGHRSFIVGLTCAWMMSLAATALAQKKSLVIGIDGLGYGTMGFGVASTPNIDSLIDGSFGGGAYRGAYSDNAFAGGVVGTPTEQPTVSGPGWSTILTGVWADRHRVTDNNFSNPDYGNNPVYLGTVKAALTSLVTASFVNWSPIDTFIINSTATDGNPNNNLNYRLSGVSDATVAADAAARIADAGGLDPDVIFVAFDDVDIAGHTCGSSGLCYKNEIQDTDGLVGTLLAAVQNRPDFDNEDWQIIVTADHGHRAAGGHGGQSDLERRIPFVVTSKTSGQGNLLPIPSQVSHADVAPTVLAHFGVAIPAHYAGDARGELVGVAGDLTENGVVDILDWLEFQAGVGTDLTGLAPYQAYLKADLDLDGAHTLKDFLLFRNFYLSSGGLAADLVSLPVPEPSNFLLLVAAWLLCTNRRFARRTLSIHVSRRPNT